jgi:hypothetical protein
VNSERQSGAETHTLGAALRGRPLPDIKISEVGLGHARGSDSFDWLLQFNEGVATEGRPYNTFRGSHKLLRFARVREKRYDSH